MKHFLFGIVLIATLSLLTGENSAHITPTERRGFGNYPAQIFYFPFDELPYSEIGEEGIEKNYDLTSLFSGVVDKLVGMLNKDTGQPGSYLGGRTRLKITLKSGEIYFMDFNGTVKYLKKLRAIPKFHKLTTEHKEELRTYILLNCPHA